MSYVQVVKHFYYTRTTKIEGIFYDFVTVSKLFQCFRLKIKKSHLVAFQHSE